MSDPATPRITAPYLEQFSHQTVRIVGKVRQLRGEQATIDAGGSISVFLNRVSLSQQTERGDACMCRRHVADLVRTQDAHLQLNHAVEIIGKVQNDLSVKVLSSMDMGPEGGIGMFCLKDKYRCGVWW